MVNRETERKRLVELIGKRRQICKNANCGLCGYASFGGYPQCQDKKLADILLDNGIVVPPVKVGDKVYYISEHPLNLSVWANTVYEATVIRIVTTHLGTTLVIQIHNDYGCTEIPDINDWGKTVYTAREEAEKTLKGDGDSGES